MKIKFSRGIIKTALFLIMGAVQMFKRLYWIWGIFANISACDQRGRSNFKWYHQNWLIIEKIPARDNRCSSNCFRKAALFFREFLLVIIRGRSDFRVASTKMPSFLRKRYLLKKSNSSNSQVTSLNLGHFLKKFQLAI